MTTRNPASETERSAHVVDATSVDGWVHLLPAGQFSGRDGRGPYALRDTAGVIAATQALGMDLPVDRDHQMDFSPKGTPVVAAGWIRELQARADGLWGRVEWTTAAQAQLAAREYRYLSPVFDHRRSGEIVRVLRASLTNNPNLHLTALASRQDVQESTMDLAKLRLALGLAADADEDAILTAAQSAKVGADAWAKGFDDIAAALGVPQASDTGMLAIHARRLAHGVPDPAKFVPIEQFETLSRDFAAMQTRLAGEDAERVIAAATAEGKLTPGMAEWARSYASKDLEGFRSWAKSAPVIIKPGTEPRREGGNGNPRPLDDEDRAVCAAMGIKPDDYAKSMGAR